MKPDSSFVDAKGILEQALLLLDELTLPETVDIEQVEVVRGIVRAELLDLADELGQSAGADAARVEELFDTLLGPPDLFNGVEDALPGRVGGWLAALREGLEIGSAVNTVEEEQNLTNFIVLADSVSSLRKRWLAGRQGDGVRE